MPSTRRLVCPDITQAILWVALLSGLSSCIYQYYFIQDRVPWRDAQKYCRKSYTDLASVDTIQDIQRLNATPYSGYVGTVWLGVYDNFWDWRWSMPDDGFYGTINNSYSKWEVGYPNKVANQGELCGAVQQGFWQDNYCNSPLPFVCYDNTLGSSQRYVFVNQTMTWHEAVAYCRLYHTDLASVRNDMERAEIQKVVPSEIMVSIGLYRPTWIWWSDGIKRTFTYWQSNQPSSNATSLCGASRFDSGKFGMWFNQPCDTAYHFMCQNPGKHKLNLKLTAGKSAGDLNDPVVLEAILNMMKKKLNEKGVLGGLKIVWKRRPDGKVFHAEEKKSLEKTDL